MSGPVTTLDAPPESAGDVPDRCDIEVTQGREAAVGSMTVHRVLPRRARRMVSSWCFVDQFGPTHVPRGGGMAVGPHPHIGLQTVTWLLHGEVLHRDSLGSEQEIRPGQLNLMTAGHGVSHSEEPTGRYEGAFHGVQLWVAQPESTRHGAPAFEHREALPMTEVPGAAVTVLVGEYLDVGSPARTDTVHVGAELYVPEGRATLPLDPDHEYALVVLDGAASVGPHQITPGHLGYVGTGRDELPIDVDAPARLLLLGGEPFPDPILMWWNYVARERDEITRAHREWTSSSPRFGRVASPIAHIHTGPPPWATSG
jgi:redox-sensitive bicupin YhaK (pirin superfamily)